MTPYSETRPNAQQVFLNTNSPLVRRVFRASTAGLIGTIAGAGISYGVNHATGQCSGWVVLWLFFVLTTKRLYDNLGCFAGGIGILMGTQFDNPRMLVILHAVWAVVGCVSLFLAVWGNAHNRTYTVIPDRKYSFLIRNPEISERQVIFRLNSYYAFCGVGFIFCGLMGVLRPGTFMGFTLVWPSQQS